MERLTVEPAARGGLFPSPVAQPGAAPPRAAEPDLAPRSLVAGRRRIRWWMVLFFLLGVLASAGVVVSLFSPLGRRPADFGSTAIPPVDSRAFLSALAGSVNGPIRQGGSARVLHNGDEIVPALLRDLAAARRTINFMVYIWEPGRLADTLVAALGAQARRGVEVRVLFDGLGAMNFPDSTRARLRAAGVRTAVVRPLRFGELTRFHKRNHRRAIVIDGAVGYTGGLSVADQWLGDARNPEQWRDEMYRVTGPLAASLQAAFAGLWTDVSGEVLVGEAFYPPDPPAAGAGTPISWHVNLVSSPSADEHPLRIWFWQSFMSARRRLWVATPYFATDRHLREALMRRARAGVDVRLLLPGRHTDVPAVRLAAHYHYEELLRAGVRIYEYQPTLLHSKRLTVDGQWSVVGSANLDIRSQELNDENVLGILDASLARALERTFLEDLERSREIRLEPWLRRGWTARTLERGAVLFKEQM